MSMMKDESKEKTERKGIKISVVSTLTSRLAFKKNIGWKGLTPDEGGNRTSRNTA